MLPAAVPSTLGNALFNEPSIVNAHINRTVSALKVTIVDVDMAPGETLIDLRPDAAPAPSVRTNAASSVASMSFVCMRMA